MYRWNEEDQSWTPLLDWVPWDKWGWNGVLSVATDPVNPDRVYAALGTYTNDWDPNNGAIARSSDRGDTWEVNELPFKVGGNMPGRGMGERMMVDPNDNRIIYLGAEDDNGLWRSADAGETWAQVASFPNVGNYVQDPEVDYLSINQGVVWVVFDPRSGSPGSASQTLYVGVADKENPVYRSIDGGATWEAVPNAPTGYLPHKGLIDHENGYLYIATSNTGGPYDGEQGQVWKLDLESDMWTDISPVPLSAGEDLYFGYSGLTIDRQNPGTLMVSTLNSWWPDAIFFRTTDGGATWTRIWDWAAFPARDKRYELDISDVPWLTFGETPELPEETPKLGWMIESVAIDPHNSDRFMYGTGATIFGATDLTDWDAGEIVTIRPMVDGLEETAVLDLVAPPTDVPLFSSLSDIGGFKHEDLHTVPELMLSGPFIGNTTSLDFAALQPSQMVRVGRTDLGDGIPIALSDDEGESWTVPVIPEGLQGGTVAISADGETVVWAPQAGAALVSSDSGSSWVEVDGLPEGADVEADKLNTDVFYAMSAGEFYLSKDGGKTFAATATIAAELGRNSRVKAVPGREAELWVAAYDGGLNYSTQFGEDGFIKVPAVTSAINVAFGKSAPGTDHPAIYLVGTIDGKTGLFRSDDQAATWVRINDDQNQWGNFGEALTGDPDVYGRVYVGTNGRGVIYGDIR